MASLKHPANLKYSKTDEWVRVEGDQAVIGITDYAQDQLGDIVYIELPWEGAQSVSHEAKFGDIESVKATSELDSPLSGEVVKVNQAVIDQPALVNSDPYGAGWFFEVKLAQPGEMDALLSPEGYTKQISGN